MSKAKIVDKSGQPWVQTRYGLAMKPFAPFAPDISIFDIAWHLSMKCRYTGATRKFYSVAQHSVLVSKCVPRHLEMAALLHDAAEAYLPDIARPIKDRFYVCVDARVYSFDVIEKRILDIIFYKFGVDSWNLRHYDLAKADVRVGMTEKRDLMMKSPRSWVITERPYPWHIKALTPTGAHRLFLRRYFQLAKRWRPRA